MKKKYLWFLPLILLVFSGSWGLIMSNVEQTKYTVVEQHDLIEIRDYDPMIVAEAEVTGDQKVAINEGFRLIADYIFGNNVSSKKVAMTAPVTQQIHSKDTWKVHFIMPSSHTMKTLPTPRNELVKLKEVPGKRLAVIRFSGLATQKRLEQETKKLETFVAQKNLRPLAQPSYAFFNPPWTLPFFRRNEVMIEIKK